MFILPFLFGLYLLCGFTANTIGKIGFLKKSSLAYLSFKKGKFLFPLYKKEERGSGGIYDFEFCRANLFSVKFGEHFFYEFSFKTSFRVSRVYSTKYCPVGSEKLNTRGYCGKTRFVKRSYFFISSRKISEIE